MCYFYLSFSRCCADLTINSVQFIYLKIHKYATVLNAQANVGPIQIPTVPASNLKTISNVIGIPRIQYAIPVIIAPALYLPEALRAEAAIP